jgi:predicted RNA-binding protein YlxR (DUF448 family)
VNATLALKDEDEAMRERRCIVTGEVLPETQLIRFVAGPENEIVPDLAAKLPGRGIWVGADRETLARAVAKNSFSKAAKASVKVSGDLPDRVEALLVQRISNDLGLARRAGEVILGFDQVFKSFDEKRKPSVLVEASDGAGDGKRKLRGAAESRGLALTVIDQLSNAELGLALGRDNVVHAALKPGRLAERLVFETGRLKGFRPNKVAPGVSKGSNERDE